MNLVVRNPVIKNWDGIRYWVEFEINGQKMNINTTWKEGKCSFGDVIGHIGYSGVTTVPKCSYCGNSFEDCEICPEFYFNSVKTQIIVDQLVVQLKNELLKELPFNFEKPFVNSNRGQKVANMIKVAREHGHKIAGVLDDYDKYLVSGSVIAPDHDDLELLEDDDMFFMKSKCTIVNTENGAIEEVNSGELSHFEADIYVYLIPTELLDHGNQFVDLEVEWKREVVLNTLSYVDEYSRRNGELLFLKKMLENNFPKQAVKKFLEYYLRVDMLENTTEIHNQFIAFMEEEDI